MALFRAWRPHSSQTFRLHGVVEGFEPREIRVSSFREPGKEQDLPL
jgi:hypothetical protein